MEGILFSEVYKAIMSGEPFDATVISCDTKRGTGGKIIRLEGWMICQNTEDTGEVPVSENFTAGRKTSQSKDPNHDEHGTVNVFNPANKEVRPRTIHWDLIRIFNGKRVIN